MDSKIAIRAATAPISNSASWERRRSPTNFCLLGGSSRHDNPDMRFVAAEDHVAATLAAKHEACPFQGGSHFSAGQVDRKLGHVPCPCNYAASTSTNSLPTSVGTGSPASRQSST